MGNRCRTVFMLFLCLTGTIGKVAGDFNSDGIISRYARQVTFIPDYSLRNVSSYTRIDNNHKPYLNCENYKPEVEEDKERSTVVIQVEAIDHDPKEMGGTITYSIVRRDDDRIYFTIDNATGVIRTATVFDRDEPYRQKEFYLTVQAMDNGRPPLADVCSIKVTILDVNDNVPIFDNSNYEEKISEDLKEGSEVMRVFAYDYDDGNNSKLTYSFSPNTGTENFEEYFRIDNATGVVYLKKSLQQKTNTVFSVTVNVQDNGVQPHSSTARVSIEILSSDQKAPVFTQFPTEPIVLKENFANFEQPITILRAESNLKEKGLLFELTKGKTSQTNKDQTFILTPNENEAIITIARSLDYEQITEYQLTVRVSTGVKNKVLYTSVSFVIKVEDVNDEIPTFIEFLSGSVVENDDIGAQAMQVRAIDKDGTAANNIVKYELMSHGDLFKIDRDSGIITALVTFDREENDNYNVQVKAYDNSPSALNTKGIPNSAIQAFRISIKDRNDNKPQFTSSIYVVHNIPEGADRGKDVIEVKAIDKDIASLIKYSIISGNNGSAFSMEEATGRIKVYSKLDYEMIESYNLTVMAHDGIYNDTAIVTIHIQNENDEPPVFLNYTKEIEIEEEKVYDSCITRLKAYDPDIKDPMVDQKIIYRVSKDHESFLKVQDDDGYACVLLIKPLDRDKPNGAPSYQAYIYAFDNDGGPNSLNTFSEINIILIDINDNAPFLTVTEVVWYENQQPGNIIALSADDYDSPKNGAPFTYKIADTASPFILDRFSVMSENILFAKVTFDREEQKYYDVPIAITDSGFPPQTGTSIIRVIIGDENDNQAQPGSSEIFVYNYGDGYQTEIDIGRVYVNDPDDWDLDDKFFQWESYGDDNFNLNDQTGMISMRAGTREGSYDLRFVVTEDFKTGLFDKHQVDASVNVTVKSIPEEAVRKSGSVRLKGTTVEEFIEKYDKASPSKKDLLQRHLASILNTSVENVDVFTVIPSPSNNSFVDVRFSAHGSPYYLPEKLNSKVSLSQDELKRGLNVEFVMISISECLEENVCPPQSSCSNKLTIKDQPATVFTNKTSFVGVQAIVEAVCDCLIREQVECFNGGSPLITGGCACPEGYEGPNCQLLSIAFQGNGWALFPTFDTCNNSEIILEVKPMQENGLIFYVGPTGLHPRPINSDFMSLHLESGYPVLLLDYGTGTSRIELRYKKLTEGGTHSIRILYSLKAIQMSIDDCHKSECQQLGDAVGSNSLLNVNGPLQLGGTMQNLHDVGTELGWNYAPYAKGFFGCIRNFTYNGYTYNLKSGEWKNVFTNCDNPATAAVSFGIDSKFLVALLACIAILLILLLAVVVHRRKQDNWNEKDMDDARETIIDYQVEGGGEYDTQFDMNVLRCEDEEKAPINEKLYKQGGEVPADINVFLDSRKDACDKDPDNLPYDDVRYYAYEGDGNSTGSLSSLASCTDEGDLKFNYLSNFGPRFRKLADMYGEDPSDEDSQDGGEESWC